MWGHLATATLEFQLKINILNILIHILLGLPAFNIYPEEIEMILDKVDEIKEAMIYGKKPDANSKKEEKELIITARVIPDYEAIEELYGKLSEKEIYDIIWKRVKEVNKQLTSYKAIKDLEIKEGEFEKTSTMKIKRYKELNKN